MYSIHVLFSFASLLAYMEISHAGFDLSSPSNVAVYWGQNSYNQGTGPFAQQRLRYYCSNTKFNVIQLAFLTAIVNPQLNFANAGNNCTFFSNTNLFNCPQLEEDIAACQTSYNKTILLSLGGDTYTEGGFVDSTSAVNVANNIWAIFGPQVVGSSVNRPFGSAAVDGFDFNFESSVSNMVPFANQLRSLMDADMSETGKNWFLTAAPQCPYPDSANNAMLSGTVFFDAIWVQFYNNYCGLQSFVAGATTQNNFNFLTWDNWAKTISQNPTVKVLLGIPGSPSAAGSGYETDSTLASIISYCTQFSSFGGVMVWDISQLYANSGFLVESITTTALTSTFVVAAETSSLTSATPTDSGTVSQWGQCGGIGYTGPTACIAPYTCVEISVWWLQCM